jgi:hypothetical protein
MDNVESLGGGASVDSRATKSASNRQLIGMSVVAAMSDVRALGAVELP